MNKGVYLSFVLLLTSLLINCKDTTAEFSPGLGDQRVTGTWRLVERLYPVDSVYLRIDSVFIKGRYKVDSTLVNGQYVKDSVFIKDRFVKDSIRVTKSIDSTRKYAVAPPQTITFGTDGKLSATGTEMTYYAPIRYFRVDSTIQGGLGINLFITTNRATVPFRLGVSFQADTLVFLPRCERPCYSKFVRVR